MKRALIIAPQWIGDAVMSQPLVAALAARGETVTVAALPWVAPVYRAMAGVAAIVELPFAHGRLDWSARRALGRSWRGHFDVAYVLPNSLKSALLPVFAGMARRVGYRGESRWWLINEALPNPGHRGPMVDFYLALADGRPPAAGSVAPAPRLVIDAPRVTAALSRLGLSPGGYWAFAPGAEYGPAKCWPAAHYARLARRLMDETGLPVLLLGSGKEAALAEGIAQQADDGRAGTAVRCLALAGKTSLDDAMAVIAGARGLVSNDSGLMHVAAAFGLPQVAVFGSTSPEHTPPLNARAAVLWLKDELALDCAPCFERTCRYGHTRCLTEVSPERVHEALKSRL
ncbi:heptosyltransferase-2 [Sphaerotilus hippei]|uniref:lipopolysaccharide heptosyltransferase II n=1 Tax=Sphaerotilus hippei TaxID=744406 RepID=A0A318H171_9BURK|nr:lipopolysaccharide heptosyltransferase II [Sphaerotilus hippei]PXW96542.1 heptosyltransferase-2 [Sphaerotilus hippei]